MKELVYCAGIPVPYPVGVGIEHALSHAKCMVTKFNAIEEFKGRSLTIFCRGSSGTIMSSLFVANLKLADYKEIRVWYVKKEGEHNHIHEKPRIDPYTVMIIIDDIVCTGETLFEIYKQIPAAYKHIDCLLLMNYPECMPIDTDYLICQI